MKRNRFVASSWFLGAAIVCGSTLAGCDGASTSGTVENIPKQSPVLDKAKDSAEAFFKQSHKAGGARPKSK
jgi:hypothetical protein